MQKRKTFKVYMVHCDEARAAYEIHDDAPSYEPWGEDTDWYSGGDDGGTEYYVPDGMEYARSVGGPHGLYDGTGDYLFLHEYRGAPCVYPETDGGYRRVMLEKVGDQDV